MGKVSLDFLRAFLEAQGDIAELSLSAGKCENRAAQPALMADVADDHPACAGALDGLIEGLAAASGRRITVRARPDADLAPSLVWSVG